MYKIVENVKNDTTFDMTIQRQDQSLYGGSFDCADPYDDLNKDNENKNEFGLISPVPPMSIEVFNNESVFSEALDHLKIIEHSTKIDNVRHSYNKSF